MQGATKGQLSFELLLVFLIFLSLLGISYTATSKASAAAAKKISYELSRSSFEDFSAKLESACNLGNGNVRTVQIKGEKAALFAEENTLTFTAKNFSGKINSPCNLTLLQSSQSSEFTIENKEGTIEIS